MLELNIEKVDASKSDDGVWIDFNKKIKFKLARIGGTRAQKVRSRLMKLHRSGGSRKKSLSDEMADEITFQVYAEGVIVDWDGITDTNTDLPVIYSPETALAILKDPRYVQVYDFIISESLDMENYKEEIQEENEKKSES